MSERHDVFFSILDHTYTNRFEKQTSRTIKHSKIIANSVRILNYHHKRQINNKQKDNRCLR